MKPNSKKLASKVELDTLVPAWRPEDSLISHSTPYEVVGDTSRGFQTLQVDSSHGLSQMQTSPQVQPKSAKRKPISAKKTVSSAQARQSKLTMMMSPVATNKQSKKVIVSPRYASDLKTTYSVSQVSPKRQLQNG